MASVVAGWTGIAMEQVSANESARLMQLEDIYYEGWFCLPAGSPIQSLGFDWI